MIPVHSFFYLLVAGILAIAWKIMGRRGIPRAHFLLFANLLMMALLFIEQRKHLFEVLAFLIVNFQFSRATLRARIRWPWVSAQTIFVLTFLATFHYMFFQDFLLANLRPGLLSLVKPLHLIGASFFCFRALSVTYDIAYRQVEEVTFADYFSFVAFFPTILAGPLDRFPRFTEDLRSSSNEVNAPSAYEALFRIVLGLFKKRVIADTLFPLCLDSIHVQSAQGLPPAAFIFGLFTYAVVLYFDFSGYCDTAIGIGNLFGINTPENFLTPWRARNLVQFWGCWHATLLAWLRDYVYIPLQHALHRLGVSNLLLSSMISSFTVFLLAGLWHGDRAQYFYYGLYHATAAMIFLAYRHVLERSLAPERRRAYQASKLIFWTARLLTAIYFCSGLIFFLGKQSIIWNLLGYPMELN